MVSSRPIMRSCKASASCSLSTRAVCRQRNAANGHRRTWREPGLRERSDGVEVGGLADVRLRVPGGLV